ncbi:alpha/beta hydrolase [soil metagenome]
MKKLILILFLCNPFALYSQPVSTGNQPLVLTYKEIDTVKLDLLFYYPDKYLNNKEYPAIVLFFGGGWLNGNIYQFEKQAKYFASRGMVAVLAHYRIFKNHKTTPFEAVKDAKSAIRYLRSNSKQLSIDPKRIAAGGGSAGGHLAAAADLTVLDEPAEDESVSSRPNALVLFNPVFDNGPGGYGYDRIKDKYREISPLHNIRKGAAPTIVFLGTKDNLIPVKTAYAYKEKMKKVGSRCDLFIYPDQAHGFFNSKEYFYETVKQADIFLASLGYIKGKPTITRETFDTI